MNRSDKKYRKIMPKEQNVDPTIMVLTRPIRSRRKKEPNMDATTPTIPRPPSTRDALALSASLSDV